MFYLEMRLEFYMSCLNVIMGRYMIVIIFEEMLQNILIILCPHTISFTISYTVIFTIFLFALFVLDNFKPTKILLE